MCCPTAGGSGGYTWQKIKKVPGLLMSAGAYRLDPTARLTAFRPATFFFVFAPFAGPDTTRRFAAEAYLA